ncbi:Uncharacterised protein [Mycobacteroides abscessus subsp. abscessus]|nr:Uncharacterised protein [Mycobacteroides abscessus subsp. abscessus]
MLGVRVELLEPAWHLPFQEAVRIAVSVQAQFLVVERAEGRDAADRLQAHLMPNFGIAGMQFRQADRRIESVHGLHQVEDSAAQHGLVGARRNELGRRNSLPA